MTKLEFEEKPRSYDLFFKGTYNKRTFSVIDRNGQVYVNFDEHYECLPHDFPKILDNIKEEYIKLHKKDKRWHN